LVLVIGWNWVGFIVGIRLVLRWGWHRGWS